MTIKTIPKFGDGDGNWSKMKDLLYDTPEKKETDVLTR
jgi:hypothetical protein